MDEAYKKLCELINSPKTNDLTIKTILQNLLDFSLSQHKTLENLSQNLRCKADSNEIAVIFAKVSQEINQNIEIMSPGRKRSSARYEEIVKNEIEETKMKQNIGSFGEGIEILSNTVMKLNQARQDMEIRVTNLENLKKEIILRNEFDEKIGKLKSEVTKSVFLFSIM